MREKKKFGEAKITEEEEKKTEVGEKRRKISARKEKNAVKSWRGRKVTRPSRPTSTPKKQIANGSYYSFAILQEALTL